MLEVDESDGSIESFKPWVTVALNCDWDHVDQYQNQQSFAQTLSSLFQRTRHSVVYGASHSLTDIVAKQENILPYPFELSVNPGDFRKANRMAVITLGKALGVDFSDLNFDAFPGMDRRQSILFESTDRTVLEDYAHHPTEIAALLDMRTQIFPQRKIKVVFQPHRYSRTSALGPSFADELSRADELHLLPTYGAFEELKVSGKIESIIGHLPPRLRDSRRSTNLFMISSVHWN